MGGGREIEVLYCLRKPAGLTRAVVQGVYDVDGGVGGGEGPRGGGLWTGLYRIEGMHIEMSRESQTL